MSARTMRAGIRRHVRLWLALAVLAVAVEINVPGGEAGPRPGVGQRMAFVEIPLPDPPGVSRPRAIRQVNPSLRRIDAWISAVGAGIALGDLDGNGRDDDLCHVDPRFDSVTVAPVPHTGSRFAPLTLSPPGPDRAATAPMGCLPVDVDENQRMDVVVYYWGRTPVAFLRARDGGYRGRQVVGGVWNTNALTAADVDGDGHADLIAGNYFPDGAPVLDPLSREPVAMQSSMSRATNGGTTRVLLWRPGGRYREAPGAIPPGAQHGWTLAVGAQDLNGDMLPELYLANDFGNDRLLLNRSAPGRVRFEAVTGRKGFADAASMVLGHDSFKGMGVDFADLNDDARPDILVSNIAEEFALMESNFAWLSAGDGGSLEYVDRSQQLGLSRSGWGWDVRLDDLDNDGSPEALQATGFVRGNVNRWPELQELAIGNDGLLSDADHWPRFGPGTDISGRDRGSLYTRGADGRFHDVAERAGFGRRQVSRGIATADVNGDGRLDFAVANQWQRSYLYLNRCSERCGASLELRLLRPAAGRRATPAIGAQATVRLPDGRRLVRQVDGGSGHSGKRSAALFFGLGDRRVPVRVDLRWRDAGGRVRATTRKFAPGVHTVLLEEGGG
jgi:enediyne biosynthesis protein E4